MDFVADVVVSVSVVALVVDVLVDSDNLDPLPCQMKKLLCKGVLLFLFCCCSC